MSKKRIDILLSELGFARSRSHAQQLLKDGLVTLDDKVIREGSLLFEPEIKSKLVVNAVSRYVSRGALKLFSALARTDTPVEGKTCLDIGVSTGGFSQVLLEKNAKLVVGVDVGTGQIAPTVQENPNFRFIEKINARELAPEQLGSFATSYDLIVVDVSFISIKLILPRLPQFLKIKGKLLMLVKPQFELGREALNKSGVVKDAKLYAQLEKDVRHWVDENGLLVIDYFESEIKGGDGNTEYFCYASLKES